MSQDWRNSYVMDKHWKHGVLCVPGLEKQLCDGQALETWSLVCPRIGETVM